MIFLVGLLLAGVGLLMPIRPNVFFELTEGRKNSGSGEPSRSYILSTRIGGIFMTAAGICVVAAQFL